MKVASFSGLRTVRLYPLVPQEMLLVLISFKAESTRWAIERPEGLS
jgi:hypothetical protein